MTQLELYHHRHNPTKDGFCHVGGECAVTGQAMLMMLVWDCRSVEDDDDGGDDDEDDDDGGTAGVQECITRERMERRPRQEQTGPRSFPQLGRVPKPTSSTGG